MHRGEWDLEHEALNHTDTLHFAHYVVCYMQIRYYAALYIRNRCFLASTIRVVFIVVRPSLVVHVCALRELFTAQS